MKIKSIQLRWPAFSILFAFTFQYLFSQAPPIEWTNSLGGSQNDFAHSIKQIQKDAFLIAGSASSTDGQIIRNHGGEDYWIVVTNKHGELRLQETLGGSSDEEAFSVAETTNGGFIIAGYTYSDDGDVSYNHGYTDYWIVKLTGEGRIQWQKSLGGSDDDKAFSIMQTSDQGYIVLGYSWSNDGDVTGHHGFDDPDYWIVKLDSSGNIKWQKSLGGSNADYPTSIQQTTDGGYIVAGASFSSNGDVTGNHGGFDDWIVKLDGSGEIEWEHSYGGKYDESANCIQQTADGGYIVCGYSDSKNGDVTNHYGFADQPDDWVVKLDALGNIEWQKSLGGYGSDYASFIQQTTDHGYVLAGPSYSPDGGDVTGHHQGSGGSTYSDYWIVKLDSIGDLIWEKSVGGYDMDVADCVQQTNDGGFVVSGYSLSSDGDVLNHYGYYDYWVVKLASNGSLKEEISQPQFHTDYTFSVYPNPASNNITIQFSNDFNPEKAKIIVTDLLGRIAFHSEKIPGGNTFLIMLDEKISDGIYLLTIQSSQGSWQKLFEVQKKL